MATHSFTYRPSTGSGLDRAALDGEQPPFAGHALELVRAAIGELDPRPGDQVLDRARDEQLPRPRAGSDARPDMHRDPADVLAPQLALAGVHARSDLNVQRAHGLLGTGGAADGSRRAVEGGEESVARRLDFAARKRSRWRRI